MTQDAAQRIDQATILMRFCAATDASGAPRVDPEGRQRQSELESELKTLEPGHPDRALLLSLIGEAYKMRYVATGNVRFLDQALESSKRGVAQAEPDDPVRPRLLAHVADARIKRFAVSRDPAELRLAAMALREGLQIASAGHPERIRLLSQLGVALSWLGLQHGDVDALHEVNDVFATLVNDTPPADPRRGNVLQLHASFLQDRHHYSGDRADLDGAVEAAREALRCAHPYDVRIPQYQAKLRELETMTAVRR